MPLYTKVVKFHYSSFHLSKPILAFVFGLAIFATTLRHACEKQDIKYQITYGKPKVKIAITQHFSLGSPEFVRFVKKEFPFLKAEFVEKGKVRWTFCPYPIYLATTQLITCLEALSEKQKNLFFGKLLLELSSRIIDQAPQIFLRALEELSISDQKIEFLQLSKLREFFKIIEEFFNPKVFAIFPLRIELGKRDFRLSHPFHCYLIAD